MKTYILILILAALAACSNNKQVDPIKSSATSRYVQDSIRLAEELKDVTQVYDAKIDSTRKEEIKHLRSAANVDSL